MPAKVKAYIPDPDKIAQLIDGVSRVRAKASFYKYEFVKDTSFSESVRQATANFVSIATVIPAISNYRNHGSVWTEEVGNYEWTHNKSDVSRAFIRNRNHYTLQFLVAMTQGPAAVKRWLDTMTRQGTQYSDLLHAKIKGMNTANKEIEDQINSLRRRARIVQTSSAAAFTILLPWAGLSAVYCTAAGVGFGLSMEISKFVKDPGTADIMIVPRNIKNTVRDGTANLAQDALHNKATAAVGARFIQKGTQTAVKHQEQKVANILAGYAKTGGGQRLVEALEKNLASKTMLSEAEKAAARRVLPSVIQQAGVKEGAKLTGKQAGNMSKQLVKLAAMKSGEKVLHGVVNSGASALGIFLMWDDIKKMGVDIKDEFNYMTR